MTPPDITAPQPFTLPYAETFDITSPSGSVHRISVGFPFSYPDTGCRYPVLYVLDADTQFCTVLETCRGRGRVGEIEEVIVVGLGYPVGTDYPTWASRRLYEFSVEDWERTAPAVHVLEQRMHDVGRKLRLGGAPALLELITQQLQPLVNERYRAHPTDQGIAGHSAGGNFVAYAVFQEPQAFTRFIAGSPSCAFDGEAVFRHEAEYAATHDDLPVTLHLAAATSEVRGMAGTGIVSGTARLAETLAQRQYPSLRLTCELIADRSHASVYTDVLQGGLEACWPGTPYVLETR